MNKLRTTAALALNIATGLLIPSTPAADDTGSTPPSNFFGMHYNDVSSGTWPQADVGSVRLWDTGTTWANLQPARGVFDFTRLDAAVANARARGAEVNLVLGMTPRWASSRPHVSTVYGTGAMAMPARLDFWRTYVATVAARYAGRVHSYEVWNEPNVGFFTGSMRQLALLARIARTAVRAADPAALMVSPSPVLRHHGIRWIKRYAAAGGFRWADVIGVHSYPVTGATPESAMVLTDRARRALARVGVDKPLWDTETNMETSLAAPVPLSSRMQAAYLARFYLLSWDSGIEQVAWYNWTNAHFIGIRVATATGGASAAGRAYSVVRSWMAGDAQGCTVSGRGVYRCGYAYPDGSVGVVKWHPTDIVTARAPAAAETRQRLGGAVDEVRAGQRVRVGAAPVLFLSR